MDWNDLRYLLSVARSGSLTRTAAELRISPSTVSRRIAALERSLGTRLFAHQRTGYVLTDAGREVIRRAQDIEDGILALQRGSSNLDSQVSGIVRLATAENLATHILIPALTVFALRHPEVRLEIITGVGTMGLSRHEADIALRLVRPQRGNLTLRKVGTMAHAIYGSRDYLKRRRSPKPASYAERAFVTWDDAHAHLPASRWLARTCPDAPVALVTSSLASQVTAVRCGLGLAVLPCFVAAPFAELVEVTPPGKVFSEDLWLVTHAELSASARIRAVSDFLVDTITQHRAVLTAGRRPPVAAK